MGELWKFLTKGPIGVIALIICATLLVLSRFDVALKPYSIHRVTTVDTTLALGASAFFLLGLIVIVGPHIAAVLPWRFPRAVVTATADGYAVRAGEGEIRVRYGRLDELVTPLGSALVVLPANEYFDDDCVRDPRSALGAFVQRHFAQREQEFLAAVKGCLPPPGERLEKVKGEFAESHGVGTTVLLDRPLGTAWRLLVGAVTTQRAGFGLKADVATLFRVISDVHKAMADRRINEVFLPLLGAGHGQLGRRASLFCLTFGFADLMCHRGAHEIKQVNIVVFRPDGQSEPAIPRGNVKRILAAAVGMYADE
jgi:hypothetical protein